MLYPAGPLYTDWNGIAFSMNGSVLIAGQSSSTATQVIFWWEPTVQQYIEETASGKHEATPTSSSLTISPVGQFGTTSPPTCAVPTTSIYFTLCSQIVGATYTVTLSALLTLQNTPLLSASNSTYYLATAAQGQRTYTNLTTGQVTTNIIQALAAPGQLGGTTSTHTRRPPPRSTAQHNGSTGRGAERRRSEAAVRRRM